MAFGRLWLILPFPSLGFHFLRLPVQPLGVLARRLPLLAYPPCGHSRPLPLAHHKATDAVVTDDASRPAPPPASTLRDAWASRPIPARPRSQGRLGPRTGGLVLRGPLGSGSCRPHPGAAEGLRSAGLRRAGVGRGGTRWDAGVLSLPIARRAGARTQWFMSLCVVAATAGG